VTWLLGVQPSLAEVVKGEKEALVILLGFCLPVNPLVNIFSEYFSHGAGNESSAQQTGIREFRNHDIRMRNLKQIC